MGHGTPPFSIILLQRDTYGPVYITKGYPSSCQGLLGYPLCNDDIVYRRSSDKMPIDDTSRR